ncbi:ORF6N domain-containing protein [Flavobacterium sp. ZT3R18]|uniref:ORF6N domain-containing protein n=1 Tax=Flavobacterium sp. ZT3R18 TaxID=2594429 RepID=UPI00117B32F4|nr:ORF6N domain-containing protein [Flavobacterium sp. ZT3R18]TRX34023.1 ORF6N domain-containing protein [Flavobacterium sp. ZT3R18]
MSSNLIISEETITDKIYIIRNQKVMLDRDLATLYGVETRVLNQAVKRNIGRFPDDFMFEVSKVEFDNLISQIVTSSWGGTRKLPFAFTEHGVMMLSSILKSDKAIQTNIQIMRTFTKVKQMLLDTSEMKINIVQIQKKLENHDKNIELVFSYLDELNAKAEDEKPRVKIGYKND